MRRPLRQAPLAMDHDWRKSAALAKEGKWRCDPTIRS